MFKKVLNFLIYKYCKTCIVIKVCKLFNYKAKWGQRSSLVAHWLSVPGDHVSYPGEEKKISTSVFEL